MKHPLHLQLLWHGTPLRDATMVCNALSQAGARTLDAVEALATYPPALRSVSCLGDKSVKAVLVALGRSIEPG